MELAAAIIAVAGPGPVHIGTDSQSFMTKAKAVQQLVRDCLMSQRPWGVQKDGDLWAMLHRYLQAKGAHAVAFSKVKGHATDSDVMEGKVRADDKKGNDHADAAAETAVQQYGEVLVHFGQRLAQRHKDYTGFLVELHQCLVHRFRTRCLLLAQGKISFFQKTTLNFPLKKKRLFFATRANSGVPDLYLFIYRILYTCPLRG